MVYFSYLFFSLTIHLDQMEVNIPYPTLFDLFGCVEVKALFDCYSESNAKYGLCISTYGELKRRCFDAGKDIVAPKQTQF